MATTWRGVSVSFLRELRQEMTATMTTAEVCEVLVLPRTEGTSKAFIDLEPYCQKTDLQGRPYVASATVFVSHAWRYNCSELLSAILDHAANSEDYEYYWFDLVCNDQHDAPTMPHSWWSATFKEAILSMKEVLLVLSPWNQPIPLTRAWCLWEMICAMTQDVPLSITLPRNQRRQFHDGLASNFTVILDSLLAIDTRNAEATKSHDQEMIFNAIENSVGFDALNIRVKEPLRLWYLNTTLQITEAMILMEDASIEQAQLLLNVSKALHSFGRYDEALRFAHRANSAFSDLVGENDELVATSFRHQALCYLSSGDFDAGIETVKRALNIFTQVQASSIDVVDSILVEGQLYSRKADYKAAEACFEKALSQLQQHEEANNELFASCYNQLGNVFSRMGKQQQSIEYFLKALQIYQDVHGSNHPEIAQVMNNLANILSRMGRGEEALKYYQDSLSVRIETLGEMHGQTAASYNNLGNFFAKNDFEKALHYFLKSLEIRRAVLGDAHPEVAGIYNNLGGLYSRHEKFDIAEDYFHQALDLRLRIFGENNLAVAATQTNLGRVLLQQDKTSNGISYLESSFAVRDAQLPGGHPDRLLTMTLLADAHAALGHTEDAKKLYQLGVQVTQDGSKLNKECKSKLKELGVQSPEKSKSATSKQRRQRTQEQRHVRTDQTKSPNGQAPSVHDNQVVRKRSLLKRIFSKTKPEQIVN